MTEPLATFDDIEEDTCPKCGGPGLLIATFELGQIWACPECDADVINQRRPDVTSDEKWTGNQRCPECRQDPGNCDWCDHCGIELQCAQGGYRGGLEAATLTYENGEKVLYLARASE